MQHSKRAAPLRCYQVCIVWLAVQVRLVPNICPSTVFSFDDSFVLHYKTEPLFNSEAKSDSVVGGNLNKVLSSKVCTFQEADESISRFSATTTSTDKKI